MTLADAQWRVPLQIFLAGPLRIGKDSALLQPAKLGLAGALRKWQHPASIPARPVRANGLQ